VRERERYSFFLFLFVFVFLLVDFSPIHFRLIAGRAEDPPRLRFNFAPCASDRLMSFVTLRASRFSFRSARTRDFLDGSSAAFDSYTIRESGRQNNDKKKKEERASRETTATGEIKRGKRKTRDNIYIYIYISIYLRDIL